MRAARESEATWVIIYSNSQLFALQLKRSYEVSEEILLNYLRMYIIWPSSLKIRVWIRFQGRKHGGWFPGQDDSIPGEGGWTRILKPLPSWHALVILLHPLCSPGSFMDVSSTWKHLYLLITWGAWPSQKSLKTSFLFCGFEWSFISVIFPRPMYNRGRNWVCS